MKVGDYVRTKDGSIGKITRIVNGTTFYVRFYDNLEWKTDVEETGIIKSNPDIRELIKVGDYINGSKLLSIDYAEDSQGNCDKAHFYYSFEDNDKDINEYYEELIVKSIVTREMFESVEYKIGG